MVWFKMFAVLEQKVRETIKSVTYNGYKLDTQSLFNYLNIKATEVEFDDRNIQGMIEIKENKCYIRVEKRLYIARKIFTAVHQVGHYISYLYDSHSRSQLEKKGQWLERNTITQSNDCEKEADEIAGRLLMPKHNVEEYLVEYENKLEEDRDLSIDIMAFRFGVSVPAMSCRLYNLGYTV